MQERIRYAEELIRKYPATISILLNQYGEAQASPSVLIALIDAHGDAFLDKLYSVVRTQESLNFGGDFFTWDNFKKVLTGATEVTEVIDNAKNRVNEPEPEKNPEPEKQDNSLLRFVLIGTGAIVLLLIIFFMIRNK